MGKAARHGFARDGIVHPRLQRVLRAGAASGVLVPFVRRGFTSACSSLGGGDARAHFTDFGCVALSLASRARSVRFFFEGKEILVAWRDFLKIEPRQTHS